MGPFNVKDYRFVTVDETGKIGSIYFSNGRIRLLHRGGPEISLSKAVSQVVKRKGLDTVALGSVSAFTQPLSVGNIDTLGSLYAGLTREARMEADGIKDGDKDRNGNAVNLKEVTEKLKPLVTAADVAVAGAVAEAKELIGSTETKTPRVVACGFLKVVKCAAAGNYLYEQFADGRHHPSRGVPFCFPLLLTQEQLDGLCGAIDGMAHLREVQAAVHKRRKDCRKSKTRFVYSGDEANTIKAGNLVVADLCGKMNLGMPLHDELLK